MTPVGVLVVAIGGEACASGALSMGWHANADVPFRPGDEFPFEDRALVRIDCGGFAAELEPAAKLHFLLECRRSLRPRGELSIAVDTRRGAAQDLARIATRVGLDVEDSEPTASGAAPGLRFTKPDRMLCGNALVSILIPAYNEAFFAACLDSALAQTYDRIEIVVCDDSPGTGIEAIARTRASRFPVRYERNAARRGPRGNFTRCFELARGEFVKFLCDDDLLAPTCVAALVDAFRNAPDITLATSARQRIDADGRLLEDQPATNPVAAEDSVIAGHVLANAMIVTGLNMVGEPSTALFRKTELLGQAPEYFRFGDEAGHGFIDLVTWATLLLRGDAVYLRERLSSFRIHPGQRQRDPAKVKRNFASARSLQAAWLDLGLHARLRPDVLLMKPYPPAGEGEWRTLRSTWPREPHRVSAAT